MSIILATVHVEKSSTAFPLAAAVLKTAIDTDRRFSETGTRVMLMDFYLSDKPETITDRLLSASPEAVGFSVYTWNAETIIKTAELLKKRQPDILVFAGGPQVTAAAGEFSTLGVFDLLAAGEGEAVLPDALYSLLKTKSPPDTVISSPVPFDFENGPSPYGSVLKKRGEYKGVLWEVARGCPYNCAFCYEAGGRKRVIAIKRERQQEELKLFKRMSVEKIWVLDPTFNYSRKHAEGVLEDIISIYPGAHYTFEIRAELMSEKLCRLFSQIDASLQIGMQSADPEALASVNRSMNREGFIEKCGLMSSCGLRFGIDLIYGLPGDSLESFRRSLDFAAEAAPNNLDIFPLSVLPGTELSERAEELGLKHLGFPSYEITGTPSLSSPDIAGAAELTEACDDLYNKGRAFPWFMTVTRALDITPSELFYRYGKWKTERPANRSPEAADFITAELKRTGKNKLVPVIKSFIIWSRTAEAAFLNPGKTYQVSLCRKPEVLDKLAEMKAEAFLKKYPVGDSKNYRIHFDGNELYLS